MVITLLSGMQIYQVQLTIVLLSTNQAQCGVKDDKSHKHLVGFLTTKHYT